MTSGSPSRWSRRPTFATERVIGASHARRGKPCQDEVGGLSFGDVVAVAVADGLGSSRHAEVGARLAVQIALDAVARFADELGEQAADLADVHRLAAERLRVQVVREWVARVRLRAGSDDVPLVDYGATLVFALATPRFLLIGQLGDGDVLLVGRDGQVTTPIPDDPAAFADETPSLCLHEAWLAMRVRVFPVPEEETLLLLSTDGYANSYSSDEEFHRVGPDYLELAQKGGLAAGVAPHLRGFLEQVTAGGSGDDIGVAILHWPAPHTAQSDPPEAKPPGAADQPAHGSAIEEEKEHASTSSDE